MDDVELLAAGSDTAVNVIVIAAVVLGPVLAVAIVWLGLRHARKHDEENQRQG
jgi:hypothetical protein